MTVTIDQVRDFLRYDTEDNDLALTIMLQAGQDWVERHTGHILVEREVSQSSPSFRPSMDLIWKPYKADSLAITYTDSAFVSQDYAGFATYPSFGTQRVVPTSAWPAGNGATLTYTAGYSDADDIPASMIHAICLYCGMSDDDRGDIETSAWTALRNVLGDYWRPVIA